MSSTTQKHTTFVGEPMDNKKVTELPGIGEALGGRLAAEGFDKAYTVLGMFLVLKQNEEKFKKWLNSTCQANSIQSDNCYKSLKEWCDKFL